MVQTVTRWLPVVGYEDRYQISETGAVFSLRTHKMLSPGRGKYGHLLVSLWDGERAQSRGVHILLCWAFNGPPPFEGAVCRHLNDRGADNRPANLAWGTPADNVADAVRNAAIQNGERHSWTKLTDAQVSEIRADRRRQIDIAVAYGVNVSYVQRLRSGAYRSNPTRYKEIP